MKRIVLGILLDVVATLFMIFFVVLPAVAPIESVPGLSPTLQSLLCQSGETIQVERHTYSRPGKTSSSANFFCVRSSDSRREVTGQAILIGIMGFIIPLLIGILLTVSGSVSMKNRYKRNFSLQAFGMPLNGDPNPFAAMSGSEQQGTLTERLKALKEAHDQGLITETEYEDKRQDILRQM